MNYSRNDERSSAINDFYRARNQATLQEIIARFSGKSTELLSYEEVRRQLHAQKGVNRGLQDISLNAIVGSVGRYTDFTRDFLPRQDTSKDRWAQVKLAIQDLQGLPPIDVYQLGDVYFVIDGNHRVSVARNLGATHIQADVTEVISRVSLSPDIQPDELIIKAEYTDFLEKTRLDELRPQANLTITAAGKYPLLEEHIEVHRYFMGVEQQGEIPYSEAVTDWYDHVYLPIVEAIRESGILRYFPNRTETDLYLWIANYREELEEQLGWKVRPETALVDLVERQEPHEGGIFSRIGSKLLNLFIPARLDSGPQPGVWRKEILAVRQEEHLFSDILVPLDGKESGWHALDQAIILANHEGAKVHGLHIVQTDTDKDLPEVFSVRDEFERRCTQADIEGDIVIIEGDITDEICYRARFTDLVVTNLLHPPGPLPLDRLDSGFQELIQRCPRPILATPLRSTPLQNAILAYDGSTKAQEALFVATYFARRWGMSLSVLTTFMEDNTPPELLLRAKKYLEEHNVEADYLAESGDAATNILNFVENNPVDFIIMGGYGLSPVLQVVYGSTVDQVLRHAPVPVLICR